MSDIFEEKTLSPMLISESNGVPFNSPDHIFELKMDGVRTLLYVEPGHNVDIRNKRNIVGNDRYPEMMGVHRQALKRCILDGELVVIKNGVPDFSEMQRRSLMSNRVKIDLLAKRLPVSFVAFDMLYYNDHSIMDLPLMERKTLLVNNIKENDRLAVSRWIDNSGTALYEMAKKKSLEGVVAKRKDSLYYPGKRTKDWIKIKYLQSDDFVVCGYIEKDEGVTSIILGQYNGAGMLVHKGHVTLGVSRQEFYQMTSTPRVAAPFDLIEQGAVYIEPRLVCLVEYMKRTKSGGMRQPVFKGLRDDKLPRECVEW